MNIREELENEKTIIFVDTNVWLNIYHYSPQFSNFALNCLLTVKDYLFIPATVYQEFEFGHKQAKKSLENRIKNVGRPVSNGIAKTQNLILNSCNILKRYEFPEADDITKRLTEKIEEMNSIFDEYLERLKDCEFEIYAWNDKDLLEEFIANLLEINHVLPALSQKEIYEWSREAEKRFKNKQPPGFEDDKKKTGIQKYNDFFLWKEILRYAKNEKKNVIFVTDDVKADWWETTQTQGKKFRSELYTEFKKTGQSVNPITCNEFYKEVAQVYETDIPDTVEIVLNMKDDMFYEKVSDDISYRIWDNLAYCGMDYIDESTAHIGTEGVEEIEVTECSFVSANRIDRDENDIIYHFIYEVTVEGVSYDYWGRDEDTREVITSPGTDHVFKGPVTVEVVRHMDIFQDLDSDVDYESTEIIDGDLKEVDYQNRYEENEGLQY